MSGKQAMDYAEEINKAIAKEKQPRFFDQINFSELFRVKGKQGIYTIRSGVSKSNMVAVICFLDFDKKYTVKVADLVCLGNLEFKTEMGFDSLNIADVFNNLYEFFKETPEETPTLKDFVPNFDHYEFKERHALQVMKWFNELITKLDKLDDKKGTEDQD